MEMIAEKFFTQISLSHSQFNFMDMPFMGNNIFKWLTVAHAMITFFVRDQPHKNTHMAQLPLYF
jgi:hypothetical protein